MTKSDTSIEMTGYISPFTHEYVQGVLYEPFKNGGLLLMDEWGRSEDSARMAFQEALANPDKPFTFPNGECIVAHSDFYFVVADNTAGRGATAEYTSATKIDAASIDRFALLEWPHDEAAEWRWVGLIPPSNLIRRYKFVDQPELTPNDWVRFTQSIRHALTIHKMNEQGWLVSPRATINGVKLLNSGIPVKDIAEMLVWKSMPKDDRIRVIRTAKQNGLADLMPSALKALDLDMF
jgi:cobaltochelatase CobS